MPGGLTLGFAMHLVVLCAAQVYITGKSEVCSEHEWHPDGQSKDVITDQYDSGTNRLSSRSSSDTHTHTLHANSSNILTLKR